MSGFKYTKWSLVFTFCAFILGGTILTACDDKKSDNSSSQVEQSYSPTSPQQDNTTSAPTYTSTRSDKDGLSYLRILSTGNETPIHTNAGDYLAGQQAQANYDWNKASDMFENLLRIDSDNLAIQKRVMGLALGAGNFNRALKMAESINQKAPQEALAQIIIAINDFKYGRYNEARIRMNKMKNDGLGTIQPLVVAWCDAALGNMNLTPLKDSPSFLYQSVMIADYVNDKDAIHMLAGRYDFTKIPTPVAALENMGDIFARYGEFNEAQEIYTALEKAVPERTMELSLKLAALNNQSNAGVKPQKPGMSPVKTSPQLGLAQALRDTGTLLSNEYIETAILFTQMSRMLEPNSPESLRLLAQFSTHAGRYKDAIAYLSTINPANLELDDSALNVRQIAALLEMDGQNDEAIRVLEDLVSRRKNVDAQVQIGDIYRASEKYEDALKAYNKAEELLGGKIPDKNWELLFARGMTNERLSNMKDAENDLLAALTYEPDQPYVLNYLGYSWLSRNINLDKAAEMIEKAARLKPDDGAIIDSLGWVYFKTAKYNDAVLKLEAAVELQPYEAEINDHLGDAYWKVGRKKEARYQWLRAANLEKDADKSGKILEKQANGLQD